MYAGLIMVAPVHCKFCNFILHFGNKIPLKYCKIAKMFNSVENICNQMIKKLRKKFIMRNITSYIFCKHTSLFSK